YTCLLQNDVNLTSPPLSARCTDTTTSKAFSSHFFNEPFLIDEFIPASATTCPAPGVSAPNGVLNAAGLPGGCPRDLVHRDYQEQYQLNGGRQNRYVTGSDAVGLSMGGYDTKHLPIYRYLHGKKAPNYVIADHFFQGAFGGSYLNHQFLIAAQPPLWTGAPATEHSVIDTQGMPRNNYPFYKTTYPAQDKSLTQACGLPTTIAGYAGGGRSLKPYLPALQRAASYGPKIPLIDDTTADLNIGDRLSDAGVSWAWYS